MVSTEQGWLLKLTEEIKIQTLANVEDSMFGHDLLDVRINGLPLPIHGDAFSFSRVSSENFQRVDYMMSF